VDDIVLLGLVVVLFALGLLYVQACARGGE
jgi:hypothetical protein